MDVERASSIIKALPFISKTIVDDTLYEKVLSYLTQVFSKLSSTEIQTLNDSCHIFQHMKQACIDLKDQDYRVTTLCIRVLGQVILYGKTFMFQQLQTEYPSLLVLVTSALKSSEGALRRASIEACQLFIHCSEGYQWLLHNTQATSFIPFALLDQSNYVVAEACQLFAALLKLEANELLDLMDPSSLITSILDPQCDDKQIISALEFCWSMVNIKQENALDYIRSKKLLYPTLALLCSLNRIIRSRVLEIMSVLFSWDNDPLKTLGLNEVDSTLDLAYENISFISNTMIEQAVKMDDLMTGVSLLDTSLVLLKRCNGQHVTPIDILLRLYQRATSDIQENVLKSNWSRNNLLQLVLRSVDKLVISCPDTIKENGFIELFNVLDKPVFYSDPRVLKSCLDLLTTCLYTMSDLNTREIVLKKSLYSLVKVLSDEEVLLDCKSLVIVLEAIDNLLSHEEIGALLTSISITLVDALSAKFLDTEWDIRDAVIQFVGQLFQEPVSDSRIRFALMFDLPLQVFGRIHDSEPYVRASAVQVMTNMMKCKQGWEYIQKNKVSRDLASKLPNLLHDTEAFVRRAGLDAIICLVRNRSCQGMTMEKLDSQSDRLNPELVRKLIHDEDSDVRIRCCRLIGEFWLLYNHEKEQNKKKMNQEDSFIQYINAGNLLVECALDVNRVVRIEAYRVIDSILSEHNLKENEKKRRYNPQDDFTSQFINILQTVDLVRLKDSLDPEHLYQEAFDINADMMMQSIVPINPDDDINMLDCY